MLFNQQQCFIYSTASILSKLRAKKVEKTASTNEGLPEISKMKYRNPISEPGTTISGLALQWSELWKVSENKTQYQIWKER